MNTKFFELHIVYNFPGRKTKHFIIVYKSVFSVFTQEFSLVVWLPVRPENEPPKKLVSADIFGSFSQP